MVAIYALRTYTLHPGKINEAIDLYTNVGWPALEPFQKYLVGYFTGDIGALNQIVHLWKFADDADRRAMWQEIYANEGFMAFAAKFRPLIRIQENKLLLASPWGPHP